MPLIFILSSIFQLKFDWNEKVKFYKLLETEESDNIIKGLDTVYTETQQGLSLALVMENYQSQILLKLSLRCKGFVFFAHADK